MTDQEREQVLKMIENGKISPEDGLKLMRTLDQSQAEDEVKAAESTGAGSGSEPETGAENPGAKAEKSSFGTDPRIERVKSTVRRLWQIPLWIGVFITILGAWGMYTLVQASKFNFWFYCLNTPLLLLGVLMIVAAIGSRKARWLFVDIHQKPGEKPQRIFLGFPLPLKFVAWFLRTFKHKIPDLEREMEKTNFDEIIEAFETGMGNEAAVVNVDEGEDGERVRVYLG